MPSVYASSPVEQPATQQRSSWALALRNTDGITSLATTSHRSESRKKAVTLMSSLLTSS
eukprot:CAMPEP_0119380496 /NCGR_PEP_ID=MMETSP1334-20130426/57237_1 /TAXON_ID=127549 /ORGANISM="Calcidiscus leptoporus, Strain RCC1130" /LENGTH=58 /DNA_ID=CAMNT_0007400345 /DNA_START=64 /DNA_END=237 /DNA_ORIENTATION=-